MWFCSAAAFGYDLTCAPNRAKLNSYTQVEVLLSFEAVRERERERERERDVERERNL